MATMAIPIIALGSYYVASQKKTNKRNTVETFQNEGKHQSLIPASVDDQHYKTGKMNLGNAPNSSALNLETRYINPGKSTDKFFNNDSLIEINKISERVNNEGTMGEFQSLSGNKINVNSFKHNNMQPFFGSKVRGKSEIEGHDSILDNLGGTGYLQHEKDERAPLFKPEKNSNHIFGAPNMNDFMQSRINEGMYRSNDKPWEEIRVAPGLNLGYDETAIDQGFNNGMNARESWQPKTVDDLRVKSNPKQSYNLNGLEGPAISKIKAVNDASVIGKFEQHNPDSFFVNNKDKWLSGISDTKKPTVRSNQHQGHVTRPETTIDYTGAMGNGGANPATYAKQNFEPAHKQQLGSEGILPGVHLNKNAGIQEGFSGDGYEVLHTNRSTQHQPDSTGIAGGVIGSIVSPILDIMRPSRKENALKNMRECGSVNGVQRGPKLDNQRDACPPTIRELNQQKMHLNVQGQTQGGDAHKVTGGPGAIKDYRESVHVQNMGNFSGSAVGLAAQSQVAYYNQNNNPYKEATTYNRFEHGAANHFNNGINMKINKFESDRNNNRMFIPTDGPTLNTGASNMSQTTKFRQMGGVNHKRMDGDILQAFKDNPYTHSLQSAP